MDDNTKQNLNEHDLINSVRSYLIKLQLHRAEFKRLVSAADMVSYFLEIASTTNIKSSMRQYVSRQIYKACGSDEEELQNMAYGWLGDYIYRFLYYKVNQNEALARDLTQNSLLEIYNNYESWHNPAQFLNWLLVVANSHLLQERRKWTRRAAHLEKGMHRGNITTQLSPEKAEDVTGDNKSISSKESGNESEELEEFAKIYQQAQLELYFNEQTELADPDSGPEGCYLQKELQEQLVAKIKKFALSRRRPEYAAVIIEKYLLGYNDTEIATHLELSVEQVRHLRHRALFYLSKDPEFKEFLWDFKNE